MRAYRRLHMLSLISRTSLPLVLPVLLFAIAWWTVITMFHLARFALRWFSGAPLNGVRKSDATFWRPATEHVQELPGWFSMHARRRWTVLPGWQRAGVRLVATLAALALALWPRATVATLAAVAVAMGVRAGLRAWQRWRVRTHTRTVLRPAYAALAPHLRTPPTDDPGVWLTVPTDYRSDPDAEIRVAFPVGFDPTPQVMASLKRVVRLHLGSQWELIRTSPEGAQWRRIPPLPRTVTYADVLASVTNPSAYKIPMGVIAHNKVPIIDMTTDSPHFLASGSGGAGKTSFLRIPIVHVRVHGGWLVDIIDLKQQSFYDSFDEMRDIPREGIKAAPPVPGVRVHTDTQSAVKAIAEYFLSLFGANMNREMDRIPRVLVFDEFGSFATLLKMWWRSMRLPGKPPVQDILLMSAQQGRQADHRMIIGVHTPDRNLFGTTDFRNMFDYRAYLGPMNLSRYRTTFGAAPMVSHDASIAGRGLLALGEDVPDEIQYAWLSSADAREMTQDLDAPDWFTRRELAPWVTADVIDRVAQELGTIQRKTDPEPVSLLSVLWGGPVPYPAETPANVLGQADQDTQDQDSIRVPEPRQPELLVVANNGPSEKPQVSNQDNPVTVTESVEEETAFAVIHPSRPTLRVVRADEEPVLIGLRAAVDYLKSAGWPTMTLGSFEKARQRWRAERRRAGKSIELPGETRGPGGQPRFTPDGLRQWQSKRDRAGKQRFDTGT